MLDRLEPSLWTSLASGVDLLTAPDENYEDGPFAIFEGWPECFLPPTLACSLPCFASIRAAVQMRCPSSKTTTCPSMGKALVVIA